MHTLIPYPPPELSLMKSPPDTLYYRGDPFLLERRKVSVIGSRTPNQYSQQMTHRLTQELSKVGVCIVSGAAIGTDAIAHRGAGAENTIAVLPCGIDHRYPMINKSLLDKIEADGLILSQFDPDFQATNWSFVVRNELVVALGEILIVTQADLKSGSMSSVEYAMAMGKKIYVLPHPIGESEGTNSLLAEGKAEAIYNIEAFVGKFGKVSIPFNKSDPFLLFCASNPTYEESVAKFGDRVFEAELNGVIVLQNGRVQLA